MSSAGRQMRSEEVSFAGGLGLRLAGRLEQPPGEARAYAVFAPCFTCVRDSKAIVRISRALVESGIAVLRYDVTGIGASDGDFAATTFSSQMGDLHAACGFLRHRHQAPALLIGISLGGAVVLVGSQGVAEARAVCTVNAPATTTHLHGTLLRLAPGLVEAEVRDVNLLGRTTRIGRGFVEDLPQHSIERAAGALGRSLLILQATDDRIVPAENGERLFRAAAHPKSLVSIDGTDHLLLSGAGAAEWAGQVIALWFKRAGRTDLEGG